MFKFIHAADIHLDSPLRGLVSFEGAPVERIRSATREAFRNLVQLAIDEQVAFVLIAGDLWDGDWPDSAPGLFFIQQAARLGKAGIPIFVIKGNHDAESKVTSAIRHWPENVTFFNHKKPHTIKLDRWNVAIHGQSYGEPQVMQDLSEKFPAPVARAFNIGLLHTCLEDGTTTYAPARVDRLAAQGYEYWALGHIHQRQDFSRNGVHISFPGNSQGRSIRETGPKGCSLVTVEDDHTVTSQFEALDVVRWQELTVATDDAGLERDVREALERAVAKSEGRLLAVRLQLIGNLNGGQTLRDRLDGVAVEVGDVWLEKILVTPPARNSESPMIGALPPPVADEIRRIVASLQTDDSAVAEWMADFAELRGRFSGELGGAEAMQALSDKQAFRSLLEKVGGQMA
jgi:DNA repair exonuclease SbcCD nuclease subunit